LTHLSSRILVPLCLAAFVLAGCQTTGNRTLSPVAVAGLPFKLGHFASLNPDCTSVGEVVVRVTKNPDHGVVAIRPGEGYTNFVPANPRNHCNFKPTPGVNAIYTSNPSYIGPDSVGLDVINPGGSEYQFTFNLNVK